MAVPRREAAIDDARQAQNLVRINPCLNLDFMFIDTCDYR